MDIIRKAALEIFETNRPIKEIVQNLSKTELNQLQDYIIGIGYEEVRETLSKAVTYKIPGVEHSDFIPEGHPEREIVAQHINKLLALPQDHPKKNIATNLARALHEKHFKEKPVITKPEKSGPDLVPIPEGGTPSIDYSSWQKPKTPPPPKTIIHYDTEDKSPIVEHQGKEGKWTVK